MGFDPIQYKTATRQQWEDGAEAWDRWGPTLEAWLGEATDRMLEAAGVRAGAEVLDVAAGAGGQTLAAARRVGAAGRVVATDISPTILSFAARGAVRAGLTNVETLEADGEALGTLAEGAFDAVISRLGLIYFPDRHQALTGMSRVLREGGRLAAMAFSTADRNEFFSIPVSIIRDRAQLAPPEPGQPGPFSLSAPGVLEAALEVAGFREVSVQTLPAPLRLPSAAECVRFERESFGARRQGQARIRADHGRRRADGKRAGGKLTAEAIMTIHVRFQRQRGSGQSYSSAATCSASRRGRPPVVTRHSQCPRLVWTADGRPSSAECEWLRWPALASPDE